MTPELLPALERILILVMDGLFAYLGYKLYALRVTNGPSKFQAKSRWGEFLVSGAGPGLLFMVFGETVHVYALATSGIRTKIIERVDSTNTNAAVQAEVAASVARLQSQSMTRTYEFASSAPAVSPK